MKSAPKTMPYQFLQNLTTLVKGPGWGLCPTGMNGNGLSYPRRIVDATPLDPLVSLDGADRTVKRIGRDRYEGEIAGAALAEREKRPSHGVLSSVHSLEGLLRTRSSRALAPAGFSEGLASPHHEVRLKLLGDRNFERLAVIAREDESGAMKKLVSEYAMDFAIASDGMAEGDHLRAAEFAFLAGALFAAAGGSNWEPRVTSLFDASSRLYLMSGRFALAAVTGEMALKIAGPAAAKMDRGRHPTAEVVASAWSHIMISPPTSQDQWRIALYRGLRAALVGEIWYQARYAYESSADANPRKVGAARDYVRAAWAEAVDVVRRGTPFPTTEIESKLSKATGLMKKSKEKDRVEALLAQARAISDKYRVRRGE